LDLAPPDREDQWDRATLARLRRCLGKDTAAALIDVGWLFPMRSERAQDDAVLVATLFASHRVSRPDVSLGSAFRELREKTGSDSVEKRFTALLAARRDELPGRLRQAVSLLKSQNIALDWALLLKHVLSWDRPDRRVQRNLAGHYWDEPARGDAGADIVVTAP